FYDGFGNYLGNIGRWDGTSWSPLGTGTTGAVDALTLRPNGDLIVGGTFTQAGGLNIPHLARWNGAWTSIGTVNGNHTNSFVALPDGDIVVGGLFSSIGGVPAANIARWDGSSWMPLGSGLDGIPTALARMPNADVMVGGLFTTA